MVTDDERREVARRLRELDYADLQESLICAYLDALGIEGYMDWIGIAHRLADLIDPDTTTDTTKTHELTTKFDRDALLALAGGLEAYADRILKAAKSAQFGGGPRMGEAKHDADEWRSIARRIREACGEVVA